MNVRVPRLLIAGLSGDSGKTMVCLSLAASLRQRGLSVSVFKKGPDYIDSAWLRSVAGTECYNLDTYLMETDYVYRAFMSAASRCQAAIIEGNRGIYDGKDSRGSHSSAVLARLLGAPVILVIDASKATRTLAAVVNGCRAFEPDIQFAGIILNRVAGSRHEKVIRESIQDSCGLPVLGAIPKISDGAGLVPSRHLGLVPPTEFKATTDFRARLARFASEHLELEKIDRILEEAPGLTDINGNSESTALAKVKIGYFRDTVFTFYYPDNLDALKREGAELIVIDSLRDNRLPEVDALYIGGGFPETQAHSLSQNKALMKAVREAVESGMPTFAECGGLMYLSRSIMTDKGTFPMASVYPIDLDMNPKPKGHGYMLLKVDTNNPFFKTGALLKAHEFHYSSLLSVSPATCLKVVEGYGVDGLRDGLLYKNSFASYAHFHAGGNPDWAANMVQSALAYHEKKHSEKISQ